MSADLLRRAADLIERRAAEATFDRYEAVENYPGCWQVHAVGPDLRPPPHKGIRNPQQGRFSVAEDSQEGDIREGDAHWMAMMGPQVAVPLAAWLRKEAVSEDAVAAFVVAEGRTDDPAMIAATERRHEHARAFARTVLGEVPRG